MLRLIRFLRRQKEKDALLAAFKAQMDEKERRRQLLLAEEGQFRQELFAKFAKEARLEQMTLQRRKLAAVEYNRQVLQQESRVVGREAYLNIFPFDAACPIHSSIRVGATVSSRWDVIEN